MYHLKLRQQVSQSISQSIDQSINQSIDRSIDQSIRSIDQPVGLSIVKQVSIEAGKKFLSINNQPTNQPMNSLNSQSIGLLYLFIFQEPISRVIEGQIISDFRSSLSDVCDVLSSLDIAIGFLASSGGQKERPLKCYLHEVLKLPKERGLKSPTVRIVQYIAGRARQASLISTISYDFFFHLMILHSDEIIAWKPAWLETEKKLTCSMAQWENFCPEKFGSLRQFRALDDPFQATSDSQENIF